MNRKNDPLRRRAKRVLASFLLIFGLATATATATAPTAHAQPTADGYYCGYWVLGAIHTKYWQKGAQGGVLGCPTTNELTNPGNSGKRSQFGPRGIIYWSSYFGAHPVWGDILVSWGQTGWEAGIYGYPRDDEYIDSYSSVPPGPIFQQNFRCGNFRALNGITFRTYICS